MAFNKNLLVLSLCLLISGTAATAKNIHATAFWGFRLNSPAADTIVLKKSVANIGIVKKGQTVLLSGNQKNPFTNRTIVFKVLSGKRLHVQLMTKPEEGDNLRITQVIYPNGTADGPFGSDYDLKIKRTGTYKLRIAESMMGEQWTGKFSVTIRID